MRITFNFQVEGSAIQQVTTNFMDVVRAERHFKVPAEVILQEHSFERWAFMVHSNLRSCGNDGTPLKPYDEWIETVVGIEVEDMQTLADLTGNSEAGDGPEDGSESSTASAPESSTSPSNSESSPPTS